MKRYILTLLICLAWILSACNYSLSSGPGGIATGGPGTPTSAQTSPAKTSELKETETVPPVSTATGPAATFIQPTSTLSAEKTPGPFEIVTQVKNVRYAVQRGTPTYMPNIVDEGAGCNWTGVGGQVFAGDGTPQVGLVVQITGTLAGENVLHLALTGGAPILGPSGYLIKLADQPTVSQGSLVMQLFDLSGAPLTEPLPLVTRASCDQNLLLVNFTSTSFSPSAYLPLVSRGISPTPTKKP